MDKNKYKKIILSKQEAINNIQIVELLKTLDGTIIKKNPFTGTLSIYVTKPVNNPKLSGKGIMLTSQYWSSGIFHK